MGGMNSSVAVGGIPTGSSSSSVAEWKLSSSLGGVRVCSRVESSLLLMRELLICALSSVVSDYF